MQIASRIAGRQRKTGAFSPETCAGSPMCPEQSIRANHDWLLSCGDSAAHAPLPQQNLSRLYSASTRNRAQAPLCSLTDLVHDSSRYWRFHLQRLDLHVQLLAEGPELFDPVA